MKKFQYLWLLVSIVVLTWQTVDAQGLPMGADITGTRIDWHPDGTKLAVGSNQNVTIMDVNSQLINALPPANDFVNDVKWSPDGSRLAIAAGLDVEIWEHVWSASEMQRVLTLHMPANPFGYGVTSIDWNVKNQLLGVSTSNVMVWNTETGQSVHSFTSSDLGPLLAAAWSPDGNRVALGEIMGRIYIYDFTTEEYGLEEVFDYSAIRSLAWKTDGTMVAAGTSSGLIQLLVIEPFVSGAGTLNTSTLNIVALDWNPVADNLIVSGSTEGTLQIWSLSPIYKVVHSTQLDSAIPSTVWSPDGGQLAYSDDPGGIQMIPAPDISNSPPTANAGPDQTVTADKSGLATVTLDGSASSDDDGAVEAYIWEPEDRSYLLFGVSHEVSLGVGTYLFTLIISDDDGAIDSDVVVITVEAE